MNDKLMIIMNLVYASPKAVEVWQINIINYEFSTQI